MEGAVEQSVEHAAERGWQDVLNSIAWVMNYKIFELDGNGISVGKLLTGILLLVAGYYFSRRASKEFERRVLTRMPIEQSVRYVFQQLIFYFLLMVTTLFTLRALNVPITIFTVIGGALAVGIGFGSQNLVNNFISGILVMAEQPMRIGDFVEVDGVTGQIESMGIRSTLVRTPNNVLITMPNTQFIEKNLTNWTMSQTVICTITVGVAYGSNAEQVTRVMLESLQGIEGVLTNPAPVVKFKDFGDSALVFDLGFSIPSNQFPQRKIIESTIRYRLYELLTAAKISIPFPMRDVNLNLGQAIPVKILN